MTRPQLRYCQGQIRHTDGPPQRQESLLGPPGGSLRPTLPAKLFESEMPPSRSIPRRANGLFPGVLNRLAINSIANTQVSGIGTVIAQRCIVGPCRA